NPLGAFFLKNQGASPYRQPSCPEYYSRLIVNLRIAMFWPCAARPGARIKSKQTPPGKSDNGRFENWVACYYRGVCTFASGLTDDRVEGILLTRAAFTRTRKLLRGRDRIRFVTILLITFRHVVSHMFRGQLTF